MPPTKLKVFADAFVETAKMKRYQDRWLIDEMWYKFVADHYPMLREMSLSRAALNRAITKYYGTTMDIFDEGNQTGRFRRMHTELCPEI